MITTLKTFQQKTTKKVTDNVLDLLGKHRGKRICIFSSPTGSGKTIMMTTVIDHIIRMEKEFDLCIIWLSIGKGGLVKQSFEKVNNEIGKKVHCVTLDDKLKGNFAIEKNEILFVNWEKINSTLNKARKKGDIPNIIDLMYNTKKKDVKKILVIDESHQSANTEKANTVREFISPDVTIEMSATPVLEIHANELNNTCHLVIVNPNDVIESELIKKEVIINKDIEIQLEKNTGLNIILEAAHNKRIELEKILRKEGSNVIPLVLVQDNNADKGNINIKEVENFFKEKDITYENGKLAIMLSGKHKNTKGIKKANNKVEFLIFKQAIAVGWDCPRAFILVKFREKGNDTFEIQTIGRILRMPEAFHYKNDILNVGYIYTTINDIIINTENSYYPNLIKHLVAKPTIKNFPILHSFHKQRLQFNDLGSSITPSFIETWKEEIGIDKEFLYEQSIDKLKEYGFDTSGDELKTSLLVNMSIDLIQGIDGLCGNYKEATSKICGVVLSTMEAANLFDNIILNNLGEFAPRRSLQSVKTAIYIFFHKILGVYYKDVGREMYVKRVLLSNINKFISLLHKVIEVYAPIRKNEISTKMKENNYGETDINWRLEKDKYYAPTYELVRHIRYAYKPCFLKRKRSEPEKNFEYFVDLQESVEWWYKNEDNGKENFAIKYIKEGKVKSFYPDYIVQLVNGNICIFDTKSGVTAETAKGKAEALYKYTQNCPEITGGIVVPHKDGWMVHRSDKYHYDSACFDGWETIEDVLSKDKILHIE